MSLGQHLGYQIERQCQCRSHTDQRAFETRTFKQSTARLADTSSGTKRRLPLTWANRAERGCVERGRPDLPRASIGGGGDALEHSMDDPTREPRVPRHAGNRRAPYGPASDRFRFLARADKGARRRMYRSGRRWRARCREPDTHARLRVHGGHPNTDGWRTHSEHWICGRHLKSHYELVLGEMADARRSGDAAHNPQLRPRI